MDTRSTGKRKIPENLNMPDLVGAINDILGDITIPQEQADEEVNQIIGQFTSSLSRIVDSAIERRTRNISNLERENIQQMEEEERLHAVRQINDFKDEFINILNKPEIMNLSQGQRKVLFSGLLKTTSQYLNHLVVQRQLEDDAMGAYNLKALWGAMMEILGTSLAGIKEKGPEYAKKTSAILAALFMFIGMLNQDVRSGIASSLPIVGPFINATWVARPYLANWMQSASGVTMIYYFLKNSGVDTAPYIESLGGVTQIMTKSLFDRMSSTIGNAITNAVSSWVTSEYNDFALQASQESQESQASQASQVSRLSRRTSTNNSVSTVLSAQSVGLLFQNNVPANEPEVLSQLDNNINSVSPIQDLEDTDGVVRQRVEIMNLPEVEAHEVDVAVVAIPVAEPLGLNITSSSQESQETISSISSTASSQMIPFWFWRLGRRGGKRRLKKSLSKKYKRQTHKKNMRAKKVKRTSKRHNNKRTMRRNRTKQ
jgi:hypothetical protein